MRKILMDEKSSTHSENIYLPPIMYQVLWGSYLLEKRGIFRAFNENMYYFLIACSHKLSEISSKSTELLTKSALTKTILEWECQGMHKTSKMYIMIQSWWKENIGRGRRECSWNGQKSLIGEAKELGHDKTWGKNVLGRENSRTWTPRPSLWVKSS